MIAVQVRPGRWADSARMMQAARAAEADGGAERALCFMATPANLETARGMGMDDPAMDRAGPDDLVVAVRAGDPEPALAAAAKVLDAGGGGSGALGDAAARAPRSLRGVTADLAVVSVPGEYAALEAHKALGAGMDVLLFSDGVGLDDELALKRRAHDLGRLVMGPGAGTAILDGLGLGFANAVAKGPVGVVAAAGTGAQEVTVLMDRLGVGTSRCYGTGGRDLHDRIGGITALDAIARLDEDPATEVILLVSKPPAPEVARRVLEALARAGGPAVACLVGGRVDPVPGVEVVGTLEAAAVRAAALAGVPARAGRSPRGEWVSGGHVRGLFSGGTLCGEAAAILAERLGDVVSNAPAGGARRLGDGEAPHGHACLDLGEEEYTRGRPHPMIDPAARAEIIAEQGGEAGVGVLMIDVVLGLGSHDDPAGALLPAIRGARERRPNLAVVAHVLGTEADAQGLAAQERKLSDAGVRLAPSNAAAARLAAALAG